MKIEERMFDDYAKNLSFHAPEYAGLFVCPLCLRGFERNALKSGLLKKEHIIPSSLGGSILTLTCAECNHRHGSTLDAQIHRRMKMKDVLEGLTSQIGSLTVGDAKLTSEITMPNFRTGGKPSFTIVGLPKKSSPESAKAVAGSFASPSTKSQMTLRFGVDFAKSQSAMIRMAYLMMFHYFGYFYLRYSFTEGILGIINKPTQGSPYYRGVQQLPVAPPRHNVLGVIHQPVEMRSFVVFIRLKSEAVRHFVVLLPGFVSPDPNVVYDNFKALGECKIEYTALIHTRRFLTEERYKNYPLEF